MSDKLAARTGREPVRASALTTEQVWEYGAAAVAVHLWDSFALTERLRRLWATTRRSFDPIPYLQLVVANRLIAPRSKLGVFQWAERVALPAAAQAQSLHHYYRALDALYQVKEPLEEELWQASRDLFNLELDLVFYDLTSTYFEGDGPNEATDGYSRDKRPDRRPVVLAYLLEKALGERVARAQLMLTARQAIDLLTTVHLVESRLGAQTIRTISRPAPRVQAILHAVGMPPLPSVVSVS